MAIATKKASTASAGKTVTSKAVKPAPAKAPVVKKTVTTKVVTRKVTPPKPKPIAKPSTKAAASPKPEKVAKPKKPKLVRDSFTIPKAEYQVLDDLKQRAAKLTRPAKKSELLRAGIKLLASFSDAAFLTALAAVPAIKTGRPALEK